MDCEREIETSTVIDGEEIRLRNNKRRKCLECSPFKKKGSEPPLSLENRRCFNCKTTDLAKFYGNKIRHCRDCQLIDNQRRAKETREKARAYLGGECYTCDFDLFSFALDIHHLNPETKDEHFNGLRHWSWERVLKEIQGCILLCKICHTAHHNNALSILPTASVPDA